MSTATRPKTKRLALAAAALLLALGCGALTGCGNKVPTVGDPATGMRISVTNGTGTSIDSLQVKDSEDAKYGDPLTLENYLDAEQTIDLFWPVEANVNYDIAFTSINGGKYELHNVPLNDVSNAILKISPSTQLGYLEYTSLSLGDDINTLPEEKEYAKQAEYRKTFRSIALKLTHASVKVDGKKYLNGDTLKASNTKKLVFTVGVKDGWQLESVTASVNGKSVALEENYAEGTYTIAAKDIQKGLTITVKTTEVVWTDNSYQDSGVDESATDNGSSNAQQNSSKPQKTEPAPAPAPTPKPEPAPVDDGGGTGVDCTEDF